MKGIGFRQGLNHFWADARLTPNRVNIHIAIAARGSQPCNLILRHAFDLSESQSYRQAIGPIRLHHIIPITGVDADRPDLDLMGASITNNLGGGIKPHGLGIQQSTGEYPRMMMLQPARGIDQQGKTGRMAFGETIGPKAFNLGKTSGSEVPFITVAPHATHEKGFKFTNISVLFECGQ